ncbi:MAG: Ig-like domain-containing protein, partial [Melioribacteraceae bacterium]
MAKISKIIFIPVYIIALFLFSKCANQLPPGGGDVDITPPQIIELYPADGTINYKEKYFEITFSEYVDKNSVREAIFISPALQRPLTYDWSGRSLAVIIEDTLKENTTYTISIGTDVKDLNNGNKMAESFTFAFSTGSKIDKGKITGKVYSLDPGGVMVFAYRNSGFEFDPSIQRPDYISQAGKNGKFTLPGLGEGSYSVLAVRDKLRDSKYQKNDDEFGVQYKNLELNEKFNEINNADFFLTKEDTIIPKVSNVIMKDRNHLLVEFSDRIDSTKLSGSNFVFYDSASGSKISPEFIFKGDAKSNQYYLGLTDTLAEKEGWVLISKGITDLSLNSSIEEKTDITVKNDLDTLKLKVLNAAGPLPSGRVDYEEPGFTLTFNDALDSSLVLQRLTVEDEKGNIYPYKIFRNDDASYVVTLLSGLKQSTEYIVKTDLRNYTDFSGNRIDSLFKNKFTTSNELDFSGASGE